MCGIDCIVGDASGVPISDNDFIMACTETWLGGYRRIRDGKPVENALLIPFEVK